MDVDYRIFGDGMVSMEFFRPTGKLLTGLVYFGVLSHVCISLSPETKIAT